MTYKLLGVILIVIGLALSAVFSESAPGIFAGMFCIVIGGVCISESRQSN